MATNWNAILASINNSNDILAILKKILPLLDGKVDLTTIDEVIAQLNKIAEDGQVTIDEALETINFLQQKIDEKTNAFNDAIEAAAAAGAGANGWTANLVAYDGSTQDIFNDKQKIFNRPNISVFNFGAKGDKVTDDILALEAARDYAAANDGCGWIPPVTAKHQDGVVSEYAFRITRTLFIPAKLDFIMDSPILWDGPADQPVVVIGTPMPANKSQFSEFNRLKIWIQNKNTAPWGTAGSVGVWCYPLQNCRIDFKNIFGFDTGIVLNADKQGLSYNHIKIGELRGNRVGIDWRTTNGGWLNENTFYKGRISSTPVPPGKEAVNRYGVISSSGGFNTQNNKWINPCFELGYDTNDESIPIVLDNASGNEFIGIRAEAHKKWLARFTGTSDNNIITSDYGLISSTVAAVNMGRDFQAIDDQTTYKTNMFVNSGYEILYRVFCKYMLNSFAKDFYFQNVSGAQYGAITGFANVASLPTYPAVPTYTQSASGNFVDSSGAINFGSATVRLVRRIKLNGAKRIVIKMGGSNLGGILVRCFDSSLNLLYDGTTKYSKELNVNGAGGDPSSSYGGCYTTNTPLHGVTVLGFLNGVEYVDLLFGGSTTMKINAVEISTPDQAVISDIPFFVNKSSDTKPTATSSIVSGTVVNNSSFTGTGAYAWIFVGGSWRDLT
ncbi:hypothetical protein [Acinetobacter oleivorans]|uniref:hypothetical protein n=1 Tax=uncultured Acinetobacter sp. TaxID=165433 RepID=UPI0025D343C4|nr:hypothetical protein [Acinetobacter oleivorans]